MIFAYRRHGRWITVEAFISNEKIAAMSRLCRDEEPETIIIELDKLKKILRLLVLEDNSGYAK